MSMKLMTKHKSEYFYDCSFIFMHILKSSLPFMRLLYDLRKWASLLSAGNLLISFEKLKPYPLKNLNTFLGVSFSSKILTV
jgi:hypothetical protein